jgi:hypothetical protein
MPNWKSGDPILLYGADDWGDSPSPRNHLTLEPLSPLKRTYEVPPPSPKESCINRFIRLCYNSDALKQSKFGPAVLIACVSYRIYEI